MAGAKALVSVNDTGECRSASIEMLRSLYELTGTAFSERTIGRAQPRKRCFAVAYSSRNCARSFKICIHKDWGDAPARFGSAADFPIPAFAYRGGRSILLDCPKIEATEC